MKRKDYLKKVVVGIGKLLMTSKLAKHLHDKPLIEPGDGKKKVVYWSAWKDFEGGNNG